MPRCFDEVFVASSGGDRERRFWQASLHPETIETEAFYLQELDYLPANVRSANRNRNAPANRNISVQSKTFATGLSGGDEKLVLHKLRVHLDESEETVLLQRLSVPLAPHPSPLPWEREPEPVVGSMSSLSKAGNAAQARR